MKDSENIHGKLTKDMRKTPNTVTWNGGLDLIALKKREKKLSNKRKNVKILTFFHTKIQTHNHYHQHHEDTAYKQMDIK